MEPSLDIVPPRRRLPAWLLSTMLHLVVMVSLPWLLVSPVRSLAISEDRTVGIVLARATEERVEYFEPAEAEASELNAPAADAMPAAEALERVAQPEFTLPSATPAIPSLPNLPGSQSIGAETQGRVPGGVDATPILEAEARRRAMEAAKGPVTEVSLFGGGTASGRSFVFLIDRSKSMGTQGLGALEAAEAELLKSLDTLQPMHQFQVIAYHHACVYLNDRDLLPASPENIAAIKGHLSNLAAFGSTEHDQAIMSALHLEPDAIFVLTDGGEPALTAGQRQRIRRVAQGKTSIHCIEFGFGPRQSRGGFLERLAAENGGSYGYVNMSQR